MEFGTGRINWQSGRGHDTFNVRLHRIPGLRFHYTNRRLDLAKTIASGLYYAFRRLPRLVGAFRRRIDAVSPDLIVTDFEPALGWAAWGRRRVPHLSLDHQHVLMTYDLSSLPRRLQWHAWSMSWAVRLHTPSPTARVVSSFYSPPLKAGWNSVKQIGPLIRPEIAAATPVVGDYILSYLRSNTPDAVLDMLAGTGVPVKVYGLGERPSRGALTFCPIHEIRFVEDLAGCRAVICAAGNQLLGESLYLGKPVLALPEEHHHEQMINAHFIEQLGVGLWSTLETLTPALIEEFRTGESRFRENLRPLQGRLDGTPDALAEITRLLHGSPAPEFAASRTIG
ncbi:MAG TPA: glycosyltransferase family protein [Planctomycetaceae bacterium]|nr:glycosyltransferase family protein [Planctomycetaceae bacterium]